MDHPTKKSSLSEAHQEALDHVLDEHKGTLTAEELLEAVEAGGPSNPLYDLFEWDNDNAAREYRLVQARWVLRKSRFSYKPKGAPEPVEIRRTMHLQVTEERSAYVRTEDALRSKRYRAQLAEQCRKTFCEWREKWEPLLGAELLNTIITDNQPGDHTP